MVKVGLEVLRFAPTEWIPERARFGLISNGASVMTGLRTSTTVLWDVLGRSPDALFTDPISWQVRAAAPSPPPTTHLPVARHPHQDLPEVLPKLDLLIFDLQDTGCTFFYLPEFLLTTMIACGRAGVRLLVLDRPNPLGGLIVDGPRTRGIETGGLLPPVIHGLTVGELARWLLNTGRAECELEVVPMKGWRRSSVWGSSSRVWIPPVPCLPTPEAVQLYPACGLLRATNISCGRGTTHPFEVLGAPWQSMYQLTRYLQAARISGAKFRPLLFCPDAFEWERQSCVGAQIHVLDPSVFRIMRAGLRVLATVHQLCRDEGFQWRTDAGPAAGSTPTETHLPTLAALVKEHVRPWVEAGGDEAALERLCSGDREQWLEERRESLLYPEGTAAKHIPKQQASTQGNPPPREIAAWRPTRSRAGRRTPT